MIRFGIVGHLVQTGSLYIHQVGLLKDNAYNIRKGDERLNQSSTLPTAFFQVMTGFG